MKIEEEDFILTPITDSSLIYDLEILCTINSKSKESRKEFKTVAYGITIEYALKMIAQHRITSKYDSINLSTYLSEYKKEIKSLEDLCKN